ncbi:MAG: hypothetical protein AAF480_05355, partial [Actinomycetota bacterium]
AIGLGGVRITGALALGRIAGRTIATDAILAPAPGGLTGAPALASTPLPSTTMKIPVIDD